MSITTYLEVIVSARREGHEIKNHFSELTSNILLFFTEIIKMNKFLVAVLVIAVVASLFIDDRYCKNKSKHINTG